MIKNIIFSFITLLLLINNSVISLLPYEYQYFCWNIAILVSLVAVSFLLLLEIPYNKYFRKFSSFLIFDICVYALIDFISWAVLEAQGEQNLYFGEYIAILISLLLTAVFIRCYLKHFFKKSDKFERDGSFLVYKYPKSFLGILSSIYTAPYGHCFLLIDRKKFYYKRKGDLVEEVISLKEIERKKDRLFFKRIDDVDIEEARKLVGKKWSFFNNCFSTFRRFK